MSLADIIIVAVAVYIVWSGVTFHCRKAAKRREESRENCTNCRKCGDGSCFKK